MMYRTRRSRRKLWTRRAPHGTAVAMALFIACAIWTSAPAGADSESDETTSVDLASLDVEVTNLESDKGVLVVVLLDSAVQYDAGDSFFRSEEKVPILDGKASVTFEQIPYGTYAVKIFHDENSNGKLDSNFVGYPKEGFGFSNDAMGKFGPPTFEQAAFPIETEKLRIEITAQ